MDKKTEAAEAYIEARDFPLTAAIARAAFEAGWDAGRVSMLDTLSEAVNAGVPQEAPAQVPVWQVGDKIREANDLRTLPVGTVLKDVEGDYHKHAEAGVWQFTGDGGHNGTPRPVENAFVLKYLPATVHSLPGEPPALPEKITTSEQLDLDWPEGTRIATGGRPHDLVYTRVNGEWRHDETWRPWGTTWCNCGSNKPSEYVGERMYGLIVLNLGSDRG